jgi:hypothetical protein
LRGNVKREILTVRFRKFDNMAMLPSETNAGCGIDGLC